MSMELVGIELELRGAEGVERDLKKLDDILNSFRGKKSINLNLQEAKKETIKARGEIERLKRAIEEADEEDLDGLIEELKEAKNRLKDCQQATRELQFALKNLSQASFMERFKKLSTVLKHAGQNLQTLGNTLSNMGSPFKTIMQGSLLTVGNKVFNKIAEGFESGFNRYDIMKKYPKIMESFGYSSDESQKSIDALDKSVRGLPTGLDEMVDLAQRYIATTGDMEKGTKLAIATNNAFLASMSTDSQRYQGMMQLQDVLGGKDMNAREWNSLVSSMTPAIVKMGESLGYTNENMDEFIQYVRDGKMANKDFIDQLIKIGNEGGVLEEMAQNSKDTWQAFFANLGNATSRMTAGIIQSLDEIVRVATKGDFNSLNMLLSQKITPAIDDATAKVKAWIQAHPEEITEFFSKFKQMNFAKIAEDFAKSTLAITKFLGAIAGSGLGRFGVGVYAKLLPWLNILGKFFTLSGGIMKGTSHPFGAIGAGLWMMLEKKGGFFKWVSSVFGGKGAMSTAKKVTEEAMETAPMVTKASGRLVTMFKNVALVAGTVTAIGGAGFVAFRSFKSMMSDLKDMIDIIGEIDWRQGAKALANMGGFFAVMGEISYLLGNNLEVSIPMLFGSVIGGLVTMIASGSFMADMMMLKKGFSAFRDAVNVLGEIGEVGDASTIVNKVSNAVSLFNRITDALKMERNNPVSGESDGGLKALSGRTTKTLKNLATALTNIKGAVDTIISIDELDDTKFANIGTRIESILTDLGSIYDHVPPQFLAQGGADTVSALSSSMKGFDTTFTSIKNILTKASGLSALASEVGKNRTLKTLKTDLGSFFLDMGTIYKKFVGGDTGNVKSMSEKMHNFSMAMGSIRNIFNKMVEIQNIKVKTKGKKGSGNFKAIAQINKLIAELKTTFGDATINTLNSQVDTFVTRIGNLMNAISNLDQEREINAKISLKGGKVQGADKVVSAMQKAQREISNAWARIRTNYSKTVSVKLRANVDTSGAVKAIKGGSSVIGNVTNSVMSKYEQNGGAIYRANGGSIFKPRGTDKIPVMATKGEFMHRKKAVDYFGLDFMRKVNNLDIRGAMNSLMMRGGATASFGRQSTVNNTVNNNQRITQNISTNNPQFAKMRMGRFAGAL